MMANCQFESWLLNNGQTTVGVSKTAKNPYDETMNPEPHPSFLRKWLPLGVLVLGLLIIVIDSSVLNVSIGPIVRDLNISLTQIQWVISAYSLVLGSLLITGGRLGDVFGRKKMFLLGVIIFAIGSVLASYSTSFTSLLAGESILEGFGAALIMPATSSLLVASYTGRDRAIAYGFWGSTAALGLAIGPLLGGYFATHYNWRWSFRINLFVGLALFLGSRILPQDKDFKDHHRFDWLGVILSAAGVFTVMFALIEASTYGVLHEKAAFIVAGHALHFFGYSLMPVIGLLGLAILAVFMLYESRREKQGLPLLVSPHLFQKRQYTAGAISYGIFAFVQISLMFILAIFFQTVVGLDSLHAGYVYLPLAGALLVSAPLAASLSTKISPRLLIQVGFVLQLFQAVYIYLILHSTTTVEATIVPMVIAGIGLGLLTSQLYNLSLSAVPAADAGEASGIMQMLGQIGKSVGIAVTGVVILTVSSSHFKRAVQVDPRLSQPEQQQALALSEGQASSLEFSPLQLPGNATDTVVVKDIENQAVVDGNKDAFILIVCFAVLGLMASGFLPKKKVQQ